MTRNSNAIVAPEADTGASAAEQFRSAYLVYLRAVVDCVSNAITGLQPGPRRLYVAIETFWEACFRRRDERLRMFAVAEQQEIAHELDAPVQIFLRMLEAELSACGAMRPAELAEILTPEVRDVARSEMYAGHRLPWERRRLMGFIESRVGFPSGLAMAATPSPVVAVPAALR